MGRLEDNPVPDQTPPPPSPDQPTTHEQGFGYPVPQSHVQTPISQPPPQGYPNHHDNPLAPQQPPPSQPTLYPPQQPQATCPQPPAAYPQPPPAAYPMVANGQPCGPPIYSYTPNHNFQPQVTTGIPNCYQHPPAISTQEWSTGLLECLDDPANAIMTLFFPCVTFGQIVEILDNGQTSCATSALIYSLITAFIGIPCIMSCSYRTKIRSRYNLLETPAPDWMIHFLCEYCALCQEYRELKNRGMDPALGWQGNLVKQQQMVTMAPPIHQRMMG